MKNDKPRWKGVGYQAKGQARQATNTFNVKVDFLKHLDPQYDLEILPEYDTTSQGLLLVGTLTPKQESLPRFSLRWDEKSEHLNIDMEPGQPSWTSETNGYRGHRPKKAARYPGRAFRLIVQTPTTNVVDAVISFSLARTISLTDTVEIR